MREPSPSTRTLYESHDSSSQESSNHTASWSHVSSLPLSNSQTTATSIDQTPVSSFDRDRALAERSSQQHPQHDRMLQRPRTPINDKENDGGYDTVPTPMSGVSNSPVKGSKRTASGAIKPLNPVTSGTNANARNNVHFRNSSMDSMNTTGELTARLKARLSYAMVKVQNGWETRSFDEVESLASQLTSPVSPNDPAHRAHSHSHQSSVSTLYSQPRDMNRDVNSRPATSYAAWNSVPSTRNPQQTSTAPSLAPAPDLTSHRRHRSSNSYSHRPTLSTTSLGPSYTPGTSTPTPQEQDAVDSLLFMSSPHNSGSYSKQPINGTTKHKRRDLALSSQKELLKATQNGAVSASPGPDVDMLLDEMRQYNNINGNKHAEGSVPRLINGSEHRSYS